MKLIVFLVLLVAFILNEWALASYVSYQLNRFLHEVPLYGDLSMGKGVAMIINERQIIAINPGLNQDLLYLLGYEPGEDNYEFVRQGITLWEQEKIMLFTLKKDCKTFQNMRIIELCDDAKSIGDNAITFNARRPLQSENDLSSVEYSPSDIRDANDRIVYEIHRDQNIITVYGVRNYLPGMSLVNTQGKGIAIGYLHNKDKNYVKFVYISKESISKRAGKNLLGLKRGRIVTDLMDFN